MSDILQDICQKKRDHIAVQKQTIPLAALRAQLDEAPPVKGFLSALQKQHAMDKHALICELKRGSPSTPHIRDYSNPLPLANAYQKGGATCLSILTDTPYFKGHDEDLRLLSNAQNLPLLRKDFILDEYQVYETRALGADCMLLIMACLEPLLAKDLYQLGRTLGLDIIVEIHNERELEQALAFNPHMMGVNNRNLKTLVTSLETSQQLRQLIPDHILKISESGIKTHQDILTLKGYGYHTFLVGESLLHQTDLARATQQLSYAD